MTTWPPYYKAETERGKVACPRPHNQKTRMSSGNLAPPGTYPLDYVEMTGGTEGEGVGGGRGASGDEGTPTQIRLMSGRKPRLKTVKTVQWTPGACHRRQSCELDIFVFGLLFLLRNSSSFQRGCLFFRILKLEQTSPGQAWVPDIP